MEEQGPGLELKAGLSPGTTPAPFPGWPLVPPAVQVCGSGVRWSLGYGEP